MHNILISGYYGFDNIGDESILRTLIESLNSKLPGCKLTVLSHNPLETKEKYKVDTAERMSPLAIFKAVKNCDMLISGGGSLLQDRTSSKSIHYYLFIIRLAKLLGKKVFIYSQGIGPIDKTINRKATASALKKADGIVVRDQNSAQLLKEIGIPEENITITADPVIRMKKADTAAGKAILEKCGIPKDHKMLVGWAIRTDADEPFKNEIEKSIRFLKDKYDAISVLIPFHYEADKDVCMRIAKDLNDCAYCLPEKHLSEDMLSVIGNLDILVGVRLHSLIYAAIMDVPMIGISYDPKCDAFLESVGCRALCNRDGFSSDLFEKEFENIQKNGDNQVQTVSESIKLLRAKLDKNEEMILSLIGDNTKDKNPKQENGTVKTAGAISIVFLLTLFAKLLGVVREMMQANIFGTSVDADLYTASYNSTLYLFTTVCYALCIAAVPILTKEFATDKKRGITTANNLLTVTLIASVAVTALWQILASTPLIKMLWDVDSANLANLVKYIRIMACTLPIVAATYLNVAIFQATDHYTLQGSMSIPYNAFLAIFLLVCGKEFGILGIVVASSLAWLLQLAMSLPYAKKEHYVFKPILSLKQPYIAEYFKTAIVTVLTTSIFLFCYLIDTSSVASISGGSVSAFYYADKLFTPLTTTILYSISAVLFPKFNREFTKDDNKSYLTYIWDVTQNTLLFMLPVCAMMFAFGTDIIKVIFESGSFTAESTAVTGQIFRMYAIGMCGFSALDLLGKAFYAMKKTLTPLLTNLLILVLNLALNRVFPSDTGVAIATSIALTIGAVIMCIVLFKRTHIVKLLPLGKGLISTAVMAAVLYFGRIVLLNGSEGNLMLVIKCVAIGIVACIVYIAIGLLLKQKIICEFIAKLKK